MVICLRNEVLSLLGRWRFISLQAKPHKGPKLAAVGRCAAQLSSMHTTIIPIVEPVIARSTWPSAPVPYAVTGTTHGPYKISHRIAHTRLCWVKGQVLLQNAPRPQRHETKLAQPKWPPRRMSRYLRRWPPSRQCCAKLASMLEVRRPANCSTRQRSLHGANGAKI